MGLAAMVEKTMVVGARSDKNCKRCGFYEEDMGADDVFDEWEFCASAFTSADGKYTYSKEKEFNATFLCLECVHLVDEPISGAVVTLDSIQIYQTHELLGSDPDLYFQCEGENKTSLPDVKIKDNLYEFNGKESWQPLTQLLDKNCKRCGIYEEDTGPDDVFDEWQVCASEFTSGGGKCTHFKENEFKATFSCPNCPSLVGSDAAPPANSPSRNERRGITWILTLPIAILVLVFSVLGW